MKRFAFAMLLLAVVFVIPLFIVHADRVPLPSNLASDTGAMFTDNLGWINNENRLLQGMRDFYNRTGVRPHLYLTGNLDGNTSLPTNTQLSAFANRRYNELFSDEAHVLLVFFENANGEYAMYVIAGRYAQAVMDSEAKNTLMDFVQSYYYTDIDEETLFSNAFNSAGQQIMAAAAPQNTGTQRVPLPRSTANDRVPFFTDTIGLVNNDEVLNNGLRVFFDRTGVRPHIYFTRQIDGTRYPSTAQFSAFAEQKYNEIFNDGTGLLLVFLRGPSRWEDDYYFFVGSQAQTVIDRNSLSIFEDYLGFYYWLTSLSVEHSFARTFDSASYEIIHGTTGFGDVGRSQTGDIRYANRRRDELLGEWMGTFNNSAGSGGMHIYVFMAGEEYRALFTVMQTPGMSPYQIDSGSNLADVIFNDVTGTFDFVNLSWHEPPASDDWELADVWAGTINDNVLSGFWIAYYGFFDFSGRFSLTRISYSSPSVNYGEGGLPTQPTAQEPIMPYISEYGRRVAEDFLSQYLSLFNDRWDYGVWDIDTGVFYSRQNWEWVRVEDNNDLPLFSVGGRRSNEPWVHWEYDGNYVFDQTGNRMSNHPFIISHPYVDWGSHVSSAFAFSLYDFGNNNIPDIIIHFLPLEHEGGHTGSYRLYRYINGAYRAMGYIPLGHFSFFRCQSNELIVLYNDDYFGLYSYYTLRFVSAGMEMAFISGLQSDWRIELYEWYPEGSDYDRWMLHHTSPRFNSNPTVFGVGTPVTRVPQLTELQEEITYLILRGFSNGEFSRWFDESSNAYNHAIATLAAEMSFLAYRPDEMDMRLRELHMRYIWHGDYSGVQTVAYTFATREIEREGGTYNLIIVAIRGTYDGRLIRDWLSNLQLIGDPLFAESYHFGFRMSQLNLYSNLQNYLGFLNSHGVHLYRERTIFLITGHSRGGAVANILGAQLNRETVLALSENIYTYTFASPRVIASGNLDWHDNIFNIINQRDWQTPNVPPWMSRYGTDLLFTSPAILWCDTHVREFYPPCTIDCTFNLRHIDEPQDIYNAHNMKATHFRWMQNHAARDFVNHPSQALEMLIEQGILEAMPRLHTINSPVDIRVYNSQGYLVADITNNVANNIDYSNILAFVVDSSKYLIIPPDNYYTIKLLATDDGILTYTIEIINMLTGTNMATNSFENVALHTDREFIVETTGNFANRLFTVADGVPVSEVISDGTEIHLSQTSTNWFIRIGIGVSSIAVIVSVVFFLLSRKRKSGAEKNIVQRSRLCRTCGNPISINDKFCRGCGILLHAE